MKKLIIASLAVLMALSGFLPVFQYQVEAAPVRQGQVYTVQQGDTLFSIARRFGTTVAAIAQANGITNVNRIFIGQRLVIPSSSAVAPSSARQESTSSGG